MSMLVNCGRCRTPLVLPPGAMSIQCALCRHVTPIAYDRAAPSHSTPQISDPYRNSSHAPQYTPTVCLSTYTNVDCVFIPVSSFEGFLDGGYFLFITRKSDYVLSFTYLIRFILNVSLVCTQPPNVHGRKKAVLVGINYFNSRHMLKGCINDSNCMRHMLTTKFGFPAASILTLTGKWSLLFLWHHLCQMT